MLPDESGVPRVGVDPNMLGAIPGLDVTPDGTGKVNPGRGISVVMAATEDYPPFLKPLGIAGGVSRARMGCWVFRLGADRVPRSILAAQRGRSTSHYELGPREAMALSAYQDALASTRAAWMKVLP